MAIMLLWLYQIVHYCLYNVCWKKFVIFILSIAYLYYFYLMGLQAVLLIYTVTEAKDVILLV